MSFGDPNNPYGPPQGQPQQGQPSGYGAPQGGQPGYGYPQQGGGQPGYGYPQHQPYQGGPGGGFPTEMPGLLQTARVLLFIVGAVQVIGGLLFAFGGAFIRDASSAVEDSSDLGTDSPFGSVGDFGNAAAGFLIILALICVAFAVLSIMLGVKFSKGGAGSPDHDDRLWGPGWPDRAARTHRYHERGGCWRHPLLPSVGRYQRHMDCQHGGPGRPRLVQPPSLLTRASS